MGGATLFLNSTHHFKIMMGLGTGSNNYANLMALKLLICFSIEKNCKNTSIFCDSLVILNWINKTQKCRNISLSALFKEANKFLSSFDFITCKHVYRERNKEAERISKAGLNLAMGTWKIWRQRMHRFMSSFIGLL